jgi:hypothetical protein
LSALAGAGKSQVLLCCKGGAKNYCDNLPMNTSHRHWAHQAIEKIESDFQRSADTHLIALPLPAFNDAGIDFYFKDESTHPTGSLKHRLARSLFLYALCNGGSMKNLPWWRHRVAPLQ